MSQAISQSATELTLSGQSEAAWNYSASAERACERKVKDNSLVRERASLHRQSLIDVCKEDYRRHFASIYGKSERLPTAVYEKIEAAVDQAISDRLCAVHVGNAVSYRRAFAFKERDMAFVSRVTLIGEDTIAMKEQLFACHLAQGDCERKLEAYYKRNRPDADYEKSLKARQMKLAVAESFIKGEIEHQEKLASEAS